MVRERPPQSVLATWPLPNYINPEDRGPALQVTAVLLFVIALIVVSLRIYVRAILLRTFGIDDWFMSLCLIPAAALAVTAYVSVFYGWSRHEWDQRPEWYGPSELISWIIQLLYILNMFLVKSSLLFSYLRFGTTVRFRVFVWAAIAINGAWFVGSFVSTIFNCKPISGFWTSRDKNTCPNDDIRLIACVIINIATDFLVCFIPVRLVWTLQIRRREKAILVALMSLGMLAAIASIIRTVVMDQAITTFDITWYGYTVWIWTCVECDLAIICASVPCLRPIARRVLGNLSSYGTGRRTYTERAYGNDRSMNAIKVSNTVSVRTMERSAHYELDEHGINSDSDERPVLKQYIVPTFETSIESRRDSVPSSGQV